MEAPRQLHDNFLIDSPEIVRRQVMWGLTAVGVAQKLVAFR